MEVDSFHAQGQQVAGEEVKALLEYVQKMPEGPQKAHFMKRVSAIMWIYRISSCLWLSQVWGLQQGSSYSITGYETEKISQEQGLNLVGVVMNDMD